MERFFKIIPWPSIIIALLLLLGVGARFVDLGTHFTHYDSVFMASDILKAKSPEFKDYVIARAYDQNKNSYDKNYMQAIRRLNEHKVGKSILNVAFKAAPFIMITTSSTNAPLPFLFIAPLIDQSMTYRQILFWGAFPAFVFSVFALWLIVLISKRLSLKPQSLVLPLLFMVCAWQQIIYAKEILPYGMGVVMFIVLIWWFLVTLAEPERYLRWSGLVAALTCYTSYQMFFIVPAYFAALLFNYYKAQDNAKAWAVVRQGIIWGLLILPAFLYVLIQFPNQGLHPYNIGPHREFLFSLANVHGLWPSLVYVAKFFVHNFYLVLQTNFTPVPEYVMWYQPTGLLLMALFGLGVIYNLRSETTLKQKQLFVFSVFVYLFWFLLIIFQKLPLTPTRTSLIYVPVLVFILANGVDFLLERIPERISGKLVGLFCVAWVVLFLMQAPRVIQERKDPISEKEFAQLVKIYKVDTLIAHDLSLNVNLMHKVKPLVNYFEEDLAKPSKLQKGWQYINIMFFSTRKPFSPEVFEQNKYLLSLDKLTTGTFKSKLKNYKVVYQKAITSNVEMEFNTIHKNGSNNLFITILSRK